MENFLRNMFAFTSGMTLLLVILIVSFFTIKINKVYRHIMLESYRIQHTNTTTALPPNYPEVVGDYELYRGKF